MRFFLRNKKAAIAIAISGFIILYNLTSFSSVFSILRQGLFSTGSFFSFISSPGRKAWFGITQGPAAYEKISRQEKKIALLLKELNAKEDNINEQNFDEFSKILGSNIVETSAIAAKFSAGKHILLINKGKSDGISSGLAAITPEGVFVGKIIKTEEHSSVILLPVDSSSAIASVLAKDRSITAITRGKQGIGMQMELIPQDADIQPGDIIATSLLEENTPQGLLLGTIESVRYIEGELFKEAAVSPFFSLPSLSKIGVIIPAF